MDNMDEIANSITLFLKQVEPLLLVLAPAICALYIKVRSRIDSKRAKDDQKTITAAKARLKNWEKYENRRMITSIVEFCNKTKDMSKADQVMFLHLTNGTVSEERIHSMCIECLAEDSRYSPIPKKTKYIQRTPFTEFAEWDIKLEEAGGIKAIASVAEEHPEWIWKDLFRKVKSQIYAKLADENGILFGYVVLNYVSEHFDGAPLESQTECANSLSRQIEGLFHAYGVSRNIKVQELGLM
jgi:hypothetical protein